MSRNLLFSIVLLVVGIAVLLWGFQVSESFSSEVSEAIEGAPSTKALVLMILGGLLTLAGLVGALRRAH